MITMEALVTRMAGSVMTKGSACDVFMITVPMVN